MMKIWCAINSCIILLLVVTCMLLSDFNNQRSREIEELGREIVSLQTRLEDHLNHADTIVVNVNNTYQGPKVLKLEMPNVIQKNHPCLGPYLSY